MNLKAERDLVGFARYNQGKEAVAEAECDLVKLVKRGKHKETTAEEERDVVELVGFWQPVKAFARCLV